MTSEGNDAVSHALNELRNCVSTLSDVVYILTLERETGGTERQELRNIQQKLWSIPIDVRKAGGDND
jgi:hypothetical protein